MKINGKSPNPSPNKLPSPHPERSDRSSGSVDEGGEGRRDRHRTEPGEVSKKKNRVSFMKVKGTGDVRPSVEIH